MSTEKPIIFSGPVVRAILDGKKCMTRRVVKPQPDIITSKGNPARYKEITVVRSDTIERISHPDGESDKRFVDLIRCPYGEPGDLLWVREAFVTGWPTNDIGEVQDCDEDGNELPKQVWYRADDPDLRWVDGDGWTVNTPWRPSIHMPRWSSRLLLRVEDVRVQRVQEISDDDILAEGVGHPIGTPLVYGSVTPLWNRTREFKPLWDSINAKRGFSWASNPWVWAITFSVQEVYGRGSLPAALPEIAGEGE